MTPRRTSLCTLAWLVGPSTLATLMLATTSVATAQRTVDLSVVYGRGVHAYFSGRTFESERILTQVIGAGSQDPRAYYFRGLAKLRQGRRYEAESDFRIGAAYEARRAASTYDVGRALLRVQGADRQLIERQRRNAQLAYARARATEASDPYEQVTRSEGSTLRQKPVVALDELLNPSGISSAPPVDGAPSVAESGTEALPEATADQGAQSSGPVSVDPDDPLFADEPADSTPSAEDPFGNDVAAEDPFGLTVDSSPAESSSPNQDEASVDSDLNVEEVFGSDAELDDPFGSAGDVDPLAADEVSDALTPNESVEEASKVEPGRLAGVLSRVVGRASGVSNLAEMAQGMASPLDIIGDAATEQPDIGEFEFGPGASEEAPASADNPSSTSDDDLAELFGDADENEDPSTQGLETPAPDQNDPAAPFGDVDNNPFDDADNNPFGASGDDGTPFGTTAEESPNGNSPDDEGPGDDLPSFDSDESAPSDDDPFGEFDSPFGE